MNWWKSRSGYWMGWIVAGATALGCCILLAVRMFAYENVCQPGELCLREWVSALSGLSGVVVAFASLAYVAKQVEQASKHHRDAMRVQLQRTRAVARRASKAAEVLRVRGARFVAVWMQPVAPLHSIDRSGWAFSEQIKTLLEVVSDPVFSAFEEEIDFVGPLQAARIKEALGLQSRDFEAQFMSFSFRGGPTHDLAHRAAGTAFDAVRYADELIQLAEAFLRETDELVHHRDV